MNANELYFLAIEKSKSIQNQILQKQEEIFIDAIRKYALPPIKGEITRGKIKWRGIKFCVQYNNGNMNQITWIEQRGVIISPKIEITFKTDQ